MTALFTRIGSKAHLEIHFLDGRGNPVIPGHRVPPEMDATVRQAATTKVPEFTFESGRAIASITVKGNSGMEYIVGGVFQRRPWTWWWKQHPWFGLSCVLAIAGVSGAVCPRRDGDSGGG